MKFYTWVLKHNKYTFDVWAQAKESFAYNVTDCRDNANIFICTYKLGLLSNEKRMV